MENKTTGLEDASLFYNGSFSEHLYFVNTEDREKELPVSITVTRDFDGDVEHVNLRVGLFAAGAFEFRYSVRDAVDFAKHLESLDSFNELGLPEGWMFLDGKFSRGLYVEEIYTILGYDPSEADWDEATGLINQNPTLLRKSILAKTRGWDCVEVCSSPLRSVLPILGELTDWLDALAEDWERNHKE